ncbi:NUDIX hydrolase [Streptomyces sp. NPDC050560]|uniref:NUDIX hydrolase n=1 Tax=Streptomyces sp. NPDC050560 TaxID=3365630 RepID=UPI0037BB27CD
MANGQWYPAEWPDRIRALAAGELEPATPRQAATVMLLRDGESGGGPAVHLLRRSATMAFAAGAYAYPGGGVDPRDHDASVTWAGPSRSEWAARLGLDEAGAQAVVCAAVRETFEETGVLLAGKDPDTVVSDTSGADWEEDRTALVAHELSFGAFLERRGLMLRSDLLAAWARWITPEFEPRRYDTWFFVAVLPPGQRTIPQGPEATTGPPGEADLAVWLTPGEAARRYDAGDVVMMPPTIATLRTLSGYATADQALRAAAERDLAPVLAKARLEDGTVVLSWLGHDEFTKRVPTGGSI